MDLIYTNADKVDLGVLKSYDLDLSFGGEDNDFELTLGDDIQLEFSAAVYIEGTEYGGIVDAVEATSGQRAVTYTGRTWHGLLNSKVIEPDSGADYFVVSGEANEVLAFLISRLGLTAMFCASDADSGISIKAYQFNRYCTAYDGIRAMLSSAGAKLKLAWDAKCVKLWAEPIGDYSDSGLDSDIAPISVEQHGNKVNHLICLGRGELAEREVIHLYADGDGNISQNQTYFGELEYAQIYENSVTDELLNDGTEKFRKLLDTDSAEIQISESDGLEFDIGDIVSASEIRTGVTAVASVTEKIVKIKGGRVQIEYTTGE